MTSTLSCPRRWGDYLLLSPLGVGGMGVVYLALVGAAERQRLCVIKMLQADSAPEPERLQRFHREADIVRKLAHGAIAQTLAIDEVEGALCIVQEHIHGRNLTQVVSSARSVAPGRIPVALCVHIVREVARALSYAHHAGIVHRDVAPQNVMVAFSGEVKLIDFGVARLADAGEGSLSLTRPGEFLGRMVYTAPEVLDGARADQRADVYSAGVLLWELLTGQLPLFGEIQPQRAPPPPSALQPDVSREIDEAVLKALAPDPSNRYDSAEELQRALGPCLPARFVGEPELRAFIARCYDVQAERRHLSQQVGEARLLASEVTPAVPAAPDDSLQPRAPRWRTPIAVGMCIMAGAAAVTALLRVRSAGMLVASGQAAPAAPPLVPQHAAPKTVLDVAEVPEPTTPRPGATISKSSRGRGTMAARRAVRAAVLAAPPGALLDRALDSLQAGDVDAADKNARAVLDGAATPLQKAGAHVILGKVLVLRSKPQEAAAEFGAAIELDPPNEAATAALARLRRTGAL